MGDVLALPSAVRDHEPCTVVQPGGAVTFAALSAATTKRLTVLVRAVVAGEENDPQYVVFSHETGEWEGHGLDSRPLTVPAGVKVWLDDVIATARAAVML